MQSTETRANSSPCVILKAGLKAKDGVSVLTVYIGVDSCQMPELQLMPTHMLAKHNVFLYCLHLWNRLCFLCLDIITL
jgi:hypothetical protein